MLIKCHECGHDVSTQAPACPHCGAPVSSENQATKSNLVTTQLTSKRLKIHTLISAILLLLGLIGFISRTAVGEAPSGFTTLLMTTGLIWLVVTRIRVWWHHS